MNASYIMVQWFLRQPGKSYHVERHDEWKLVQILSRHYGQTIIPPVWLLQGKLMRRKGLFYSQANEMEYVSPIAVGFEYLYFFSKKSSMNVCLFVFFFNKHSFNFLFSSPLIIHLYVFRKLLLLCKMHVVSVWLVWAAWHFRDFFP